jgi:IS30 family transposase
MKKYKQLSQEQRYIIAHMVKQNLSKAEIAKEIGCSASTIYRELKRNCIAGVHGGRGSYHASKAHNRALLRHRYKPKHIKLTDHQKLYIRTRLYIDRFSPELIAAQGRKDMGSFVSYETIYHWIWRCKRLSDDEDKKLYTYLRHGHRKRKRGNRKRNRGTTIPERITIDRRGKVASRRKRMGDLEVDFMLGRQRQCPILVVTDRTTLFTRLVKLECRKASVVKEALLQIIQSMPAKTHTLTFDNDMSFSLHYQLRSACNVKTYFTRPYAAHEKGSIENRIGVIRRFLPKKTDFRSLTYENVKNIESILNNRPVRKFKYLTPIQVSKPKTFALIR